MCCFSRIGNPKQNLRTANTWFLCEDCAIRSLHLCSIVLTIGETELVPHLDLKVEDFYQSTLLLIRLQLDSETLSSALRR